MSPSPIVFVGVTVMLFGGAAALAGQALAANWRPRWQIFAYGLLLGLANRFLVYALFDGDLFSAVGYLRDTLVLLAIAAVAHRVTEVHKMVSQYPWLYERAGPLRWRRRGE